MLLIAYWLHPWANMTRALKAIPRALADDVLVIATGPRHERIFHDAYQATIKYFWCMGAKVAADKGDLFSTNATTRHKLRHHVWAITNATMAVGTHLRHLGA